MQILDCRKIKEKEIFTLKKSIKGNLTLVVIQIGNFKENALYLKNKKRLALEFGVELIELKYQESNSKEEIINKILELNVDKTVTGIMIQKPILEKFDYQELVNYIDYRKDVDGVGKENQERLKEKKESIIPCTVRAILKIFHEYQIPLQDRKIAIIGKSNLVGMPLYQILKRNNQVTLCDSKTENLKEKVRQAEIVIIAIGKANYFDDDYFEDGQVIIDVGTNYLNGKVVGDVDFGSLEKEVLITPVPGGVGSLTPIYLFENLLETDQLQNYEK